MLRFLFALSLNLSMSAGGGLSVDGCDVYLNKNLEFSVVLSCNYMMWSANFTSSNKIRSVSKFVQSVHVIFLFIVLTNLQNNLHILRSTVRKGADAPPQRQHSYLFPQ